MNIIESITKIEGDCHSEYKNIEVSADDGCQSASGTGSFDRGIGRQWL